MKTIKNLSIILLSLFLLTACNLSKQFELNSIGSDKAKEIAENFINDVFTNGTQKIEILEVTEDLGLYKIKIKTPDGQETDAYISKNGEVFFPQGLNIKETTEKKKKRDEENKKAEAKAIEDIPTAEKVNIELFVMSYCPYGTQMERGLIPVLNLLKDKVNFELKFVDYSMHQKKEIDEQLNQYCIQKNQPKNLISYLTCFLKNGDGAKCLTKATIDMNQLSSCVKETDEQFQITANYENKETWESRYPPFNTSKEDNEKYFVKGSPTLIINGTKVKTGRSPKALLDTVCAGFANPPAECSEELSAENPATGFGGGISGEGSDASCGS